MKSFTRRSLFGLIPAPFAGGLGLLTTVEEPTPAPDSDPVAEAALAVRDEIQTHQGALIMLERARHRDPKLADKLEHQWGEWHPTSITGRSRLRKHSVNP